METVAHYKHVFLYPSETFVRSQIDAIERYRCLAVCERYLPNEVTQGIPVAEVPRIDSALHKLARIKPLIGLSLMSEDVRIVHAHFGKNGWRALSIAGMLRVPLVVSFYGRDASAVPRNARWLGKYRRLFRGAAAVLVLSEHMRGQLLDIGCPPEKLHLQPFGVDTQAVEFRPSRLPAGGSVKLLFVGRLSRKKGILTALRAMPGLPGCVLRIAGSGEMETEVLSEVKKLGLTDRVELLGWLSSDEVTEEMHRAHVLLVPSETAPDGDTEGTPTVIFEAMACGLPVVASSHAGIPEQLDDGGCGLLFSQSDEKGLTKAVTRLTGSPDTYSEIASKARRRVEERYDSRKLAGKLEELYYRLSI
jgi:glycosyltransferase involved in cell wall biosynthesis